MRRIIEEDKGVINSSFIEKKGLKDSEQFSKSFCFKYDIKMT